TLSQVNADLSTLADQENTTASDTIVMAAGDGTASTPNSTIAVTVASTNVPPAITAPSSATVQQNQATAITGVSISDSDAVSRGETIIVVLGDSNGLLSATTGA